MRVKDGSEAERKGKGVVQADRYSKLGVFTEAGGRMVWGGNEEDPHTSKPHSMRWEENRQDLQELQGKWHPQISFIYA